MKIAIDARMLGERGIGRYIEQLILNLEKIDNTNQYYVILTKDNFDKYTPKNQNFNKIIANFRWYSLKEQLLFPNFLNKYNFDLVHFTHFNVPILYRKPYIVTIHDLIILKFPTIKASTLSPIIYKIKKFFSKIVIKHAIKYAKNIITVSEFTKNDVISYFNLKDKYIDKINVIYEGVTKLNTESSDNIEILNNIKKIKPYIIYVGSAYPHKNLENLCDAFKNIDDLNLVLVGKKDFFYNRLEIQYKDLINKKIFLTDYLDDNTLSLYFKNALFYVFPSLYEGFGLPPLEAMQYGVPILSSNASCLPEILKDSAEYFNPNDVKDITDAINKLKNNLIKLEELKNIGLLFYRRYSWLDMAKKTLNIYYL